MTRAAVIDEATDLLLDLRSASYLTEQLPHVERQLLQRLPILSEIRILGTTWTFGQWTQSSQTFTDATASLQSGVAQALTTLTNNDGFLLGATGQMDDIRLTVSTASSGGAPVWEYAYWDGTAWVVFTPVATPTLGATGATTLVLLPPETWRQGAPSDVTFPAGLDTNLFWIRARATTAPTVTAPRINAMTVLTALYPLGEEVVQLQAAIYAPNELEPVPVASSLDYWDTAWQTLTGTPQYLTQDLDSAHRVRLVPRATTVAARGANLPSGLPSVTTGNLVFLTVEVPTCDDAPTFWDGLCSYALAAAEASRLSEAQDLALAQGLQGLVDVLVSILTDLWASLGSELAPPVWPIRRR